MYEVKSRTRKIKGVEVETWEREIIDANILSVEAGTNGYQGGDTDIHAKVIENRYGDTMGIEISLGGDAELATIIEALKFITKVLEEGQEAAL